MKKILILFFVSFFISCENDEKITTNNKILGQKNWITTIGGSLDDAVRQVISTSDGGFLIVGYTKSSDGDIIDNNSQIEEAWVVKFDSYGHISWSKTFGGMMDDYAYSVVEDAEGNYLIAGYSMSMNGDVPMNLGMHDFWLFKLSSQGNLMWSKTYGYSSHDHAHKIIPTSDGGYFVVGFTDYSGGVGDRNSNVLLHGVGEYYGLKLNNEGEKEWDAYFGGTQNERVFDVVEANDGGFVMVGYSESNDFDVNDNKGSYDYWVVKVKADGILDWKKSYGGSDIDQAYGILKVNNNYIISGNSNSQDGDVSHPKGNNDIWVIAIDDFGNLIWEKSYGGEQNDMSNHILKTNSNEIVITGHTRTNDGSIGVLNGENDIFVFSINSGGNLNWMKTFGGSSFDFGISATQLKDNSLIIVGETQSNDFDITLNKGQKEIMIINLK